MSTNFNLWDSWYHLHQIFQYLDNMVSAPLNQISIKMSHSYSTCTYTHISHIYDKVPLDFWHWNSKQTSLNERNIAISGTSKINAVQMCNASNRRGILACFAANVYVYLKFKLICNFRHIQLCFWLLILAYLIEKREQKQVLKMKILTILSFPYLRCTLEKYREKQFHL